jgi:simple sugar transport system substrate-binding protein
VRLRAACRTAVALAAALTAGGCGATSEVREPDLVVSGTTPAPAAGDRAPERDEGTTIAVVTHGQASSQFWAIVRNGIDAAERQMNVDVEYRAPDVYDVQTMSGLIDAAVAQKPDGLVVSIPSGELAPAIRRAIDAGIPVVSINSGSDVSRRLGTLAHIGQPEEIAGYKAGERLIAAGAANALCVNQEPGNAGLDRRCAGFARALREAGRSSRVLAVDDKDLAGTRRQLAEASSRNGVDAVLTLNSTVGEMAAESVPRRVVIGTFDYNPGVLTAVASGRIEFAVDQQPYLQGYLPVVLLAERARYGLFPAEGEVIPTGPSFITRDNAAQAERLSQLGIR